MNAPSTSHTRKGRFNLLIIKASFDFPRLRFSPMGVRAIGSGLESFNHPRRKKATVRRGNITQDGCDQLSSMGAELKGPVEIQFIDQFGQEEWVILSCIPAITNALLLPRAGIDGGGVFKEFLTS